MNDDRSYGQRRRISRIIADVIIKENQPQTPIQDNESNIGKQVHTDIERMIDEHRNKKEMLLYLNNKYPDYSKAKYFSGYIDDAFQKRMKRTKGREDDER